PEHPRRPLGGRGCGGAGRSAGGRRLRRRRLPGREPAGRQNGRGALMLLGIDTSGAVSVAVARGELPAPGTTSAAPEILAVRGDERARHHDEVLLSLVDSALREAGASRSELTGVVVGRGPGPFTGL